MSRKIVRTWQPGVTVSGDRIRLGQLISNLVQNAQRHASSTITITVRRADGDPRFPEKAAELEVLDDGAGVAADQRETVFQRFTRLDTARSRMREASDSASPSPGRSPRATAARSPSRTRAKLARFVIQLPLDS